MDWQTLANTARRDSRRSSPEESVKATSASIAAFFSSFLWRMIPASTSAAARRNSASPGSKAWPSLR